MAYASFRNITYTPNAGEVWITGGFVTNNASSPVLFQGPSGLSATLPNGVTSILRTGAGTHVITFAYNFFCCLYAGCDLAMGTPTNNFAQFNGFTNLNSATAALTGTVSTFIGAAVGDLVAGSNTNIISFTFSFKNSSVV